ncbi:UNVERIFIED_CONTAM: hypothetical protein RMT77_017120 [Armadillidium vulgare]
MEGSCGPPFPHIAVKGATLPGQRSGQYRSPNFYASITRRSSDGDLTEAKRSRDKCRIYESPPRVWVSTRPDAASYRSESPSGETGRIISDPIDTPASWESPDLAPQFSTRPTLTPLAAPASPRPQVRKSFNTFPRPWKARSRSPSPFRIKDQSSKSSSDHFHFKTFSDSLKQLKFSLESNKDEVRKVFSCLDNETNKSLNISNSFSSKTSFYNEIYAKPYSEDEKYNQTNIYKSVATISVSQPKINESHSSIRDLSSYKICNKTYNNIVQTTKPNNNVVEFEGISKHKIQQVVGNEKKDKALQPDFKYKYDDEGGHFYPSSLPQATKYSYSGSSLPSVADKVGSAPLPCDGGNSASLSVPKYKISHSVSFNTKFLTNKVCSDNKTKEVGKTVKYLRFEKQGNSAGGSGPGDREAPLTECSVNNLMQASGKKIVRKKPQIPDKLSVRRTAEGSDDRKNEHSVLGHPPLTSSLSFTPDTQQHCKLVKKRSLPSLVTTKTQDLTPSRTLTDEKTECSKNRTTVSQILSTLNFARFRLEELTGALGGSKKDSSKGPAANGKGGPCRPPRGRHDVEKLRKHSEKLRNSEKKSISEGSNQSSDRFSLKERVRSKAEGSRHTFLHKQPVTHINSSPVANEALNIVCDENSPIISNFEGVEKNKSAVFSNSGLLPSPSSLQSASEIRDIPFRTASVSHVDLTCEKNSGKISPNLKLYPACKDSGRAHTLPRCSTIVQNSESSLTSTETLKKNSLTSSFNEFKIHNLDDSKYDICKFDSDTDLCEFHSECSGTYSRNEPGNVKSTMLEGKSSNMESDTSEFNSKLREEDSIISKLLQGDSDETYNVDGNRICNLSVGGDIEAQNSLKQHEEKFTNLYLSSTSVTKQVKMKRSLGIDSRVEESVSDVTFEEGDFNNSKPCKDISVQTEDTFCREKERLKKKYKSKSVEDKREMFRLRLGQSKNFSEETYKHTDAELMDCSTQFDVNLVSQQHCEKPQKFRKGSVVECRVIETEPRSSQCIVIRSSSFNKSKDGQEFKEEREPRATSECRVVQTRQRLSFEDSECESVEANRISQSSPNGKSPVHECLQKFSNESPSDSSSQDSFGIHSQKTRSGQNEFIEEINRPMDNIEKTESRRRKRMMDELDEKNCTRKENSESENATNMKCSKVARRQENLKKFNRHYTEKKNVFADSYMSDGESRPNSYSEPESLQVVVKSKVSKSEKKKKNRSDPGFKRNKADHVVYFSDSNIEQYVDAKKLHKNNATNKNRSNNSQFGVVSQTSTDSEGKDDTTSNKRNSQDMFRFSRREIPKQFQPPVILSGQESDASCQDVFCLGGDYNMSRNISRNTSPSIYLGDSDSGERCVPKSPHVPRRYSKRPLRGPYGEMLEAEMSKSKSSSQFLSEDIFLRPRDGNSMSPRPSSPISPIIMPIKNFEHNETSPAIFVGSENGSPRPSSISIPASRSLDDTALRLYYSSAGSKSDNHLKPSAAAVYPNYESDSEGIHSLLPSGPMHQRTASSPSKLFFEPCFTSEEDREVTSFYKPPPAQPVQPPQNLQIESTDINPPHTLKERSSFTKLKHSKTKQERHLKTAKIKKLPEEESRSHLQKKGPYESEFLALAEHRHIHRRHRDTRAHIIGEIHDTEKNYVDNLNFLLTRYEQPLRSSESSAIIDSSLVDDIFFQVPEIHSHHQRLLDELKMRLESKDANICIGDVLLQMLKEPAVAESYLSFVNNWKTAQEAAKAAVHAKPAFRHFLVAMAKEHPGKLDLKALLITPVQRFPHYELILKRLLEHTSKDHPDYSLVKEAISEVQKVAASINDIEQEALQQEQQQFILKEIENFIEGLVGLVQPDRTFLQLDLVTQNSGLGIRKERCLFLFSDILVITAIKRRSATIRKSSSLQLPLLSSLESCKLKLFKFISLDDLEIGRSRDDSMKKLAKELECLEQDIQTLSQISRLMKTLHFPKGSLEDALNDLDSSLRKQLLDRQGADSQLSELELNITTQEGIESLNFMFSNSEKRNKWEEEFNFAKQKLALSADRRPPPEFVNALPIRKTRAGLQFTCAAPTLGLNAHNLKDVWVCNSDGYVGQVCVMSLQPEPTLACCNGVCNAKILSIASIPAAPPPDSSDDDEDEDLSVEEDLRKRRSESLPPDIGTDENDNLQPTMWLGTEDGSIHVYNCNDTIRTKKNKLKFQPGSPVHCIIHIEMRVFASLANGDVVVYDRDSQGGWNSGEKHIINLSTAAAPVTRMVMAAGKLWCSASSSIKILNVNTLQIEHSFTVGGENSKGVACMVCAGHGVWIAMHYSAVVRLYHATTHESICEISVTSPVTKMLAGCDDIIRQHKLACLKVTALLACKDLLWIGTSAGVIITLPLPHLSHNTRRLQSTINMVGIPHGHTGNVRFLTCVEMTPESRPSRLKSHSRYSFKGKDHQHHQSGTAAPSKLLVLSGGDGYEDFRNSAISELAGRDDSTNHLLLWQV